VLATLAALGGGCQAADGRAPAAAESASQASDALPSQGPDGGTEGALPTLAEATAQVETSRRTAIVRAASEVAPAVVTVNTLRTQRVRPTSLWESFFLPPGAARRVTGLGSSSTGARAS
jgi:hypothetical protein